MHFKILDSTSDKLDQMLQNMENTDFDYSIFNTKDMAIEVEEGENDERPSQIVNAQIAEFDLGTTKAEYLLWSCDPKYKSTLHVNEKPLIAKNITWQYGRIAWRAAPGWPLFEIPCPRPGRRDGLHSIIAQFGGKAFVSCKSPASGSGVHATQVSFSVLDTRGKHGDNSGFFEVIITSYSK